MNKCFGKIAHAHLVSPALSKPFHVSCLYGYYNIKILDTRIDKNHNTHSRNAILTTARTIFIYFNIYNLYLTTKETRHVLIIFHPQSTHTAYTLNVPMLISVYHNYVFCSYC